MSPSSQWLLFPWDLPPVRSGGSRSHDYLSPLLSPFEWSKKGQLTWAGPIWFSSQIFRIDVGKQVSYLEWVKQKGEHRSSEAATLYYKDLKKRECCLQKEKQRWELERVPGILGFHFHPSWSPGALDRTPRIPVIIELRSLSLARVGFYNLHQKNLK